MKMVYCMPDVTGLTNGSFAEKNLYSKKEVVYVKHFNQPSLNISLHPFCAPRDVRAIYNWVRKLHRAAGSIAASYRYTGYSDFACSFMVHINNRLPVCEIDICTADKDELCQSFRVSPGDYIIRLLMNAKTKPIRRHQLQALQTCIEYFFTFPEIRQIFAAPAADDQQCNYILQHTGFQFEHQLYDQYTTCNLFRCTRQSFVKE